MSLSEPDVDVAAANHAAWQQVQRWSTSTRMNEFETLMWRTERHPSQSMTTVTLLTLDSVPEWERLRAAHDWASRAVVRFRQRVVAPLLPTGPAAWQVDPRFDLDYHLRRVHLPGKGDHADLLTFAQGAALAPFDRSRPLWEATLIEGLDDGTAAYLFKVHHSVTDGMGIVQLMSLLQSRTREPSPHKPAPESVDSPDTDPIRLSVAQIAEQAVTIPAFAGRALTAGARALVTPGRTARSALTLGRSLGRVTDPLPPSSPLFRQRTGMLWRFGTRECPLADLRTAAKAGGGSLNDAFLAALLGGLRIYHERNGIHLDRLPMVMPLSLRAADDPLGGNRWTGGMFTGPIGIVDPVERMAAVRRIVRPMREDPDVFSMLSLMVNRTPAVLGVTAQQAGPVADISASNVPGMREAQYIAGARVERWFALGPLPGVAVMAILVSHAGTCCMAFNMDGSVIPDPEAFLGCIDEGMDEVLDLAR